MLPLNELRLTLLHELALLPDRLTRGGVETASRRLLLELALRLSLPLLYELLALLLTWLELLPLLRVELRLSLCRLLLHELPLPLLPLYELAVTGDRGRARTLLNLPRVATEVSRRLCAALQCTLPGTLRNLSVHVMDALHPRCVRILFRRIGHNDDAEGLAVPFLRVADTNMPRGVRDCRAFALSDGDGLLTGVRNVDG